MKLFLVLCIHACAAMSAFNGYWLGVSILYGQAVLVGYLSLASSLGFLWNSLLLIAFCVILWGIAAFGSPRMPELVALNASSLLVISQFLTFCCELFPLRKNASANISKTLSRIGMICISLGMCRVVSAGELDYLSFENLGIGLLLSLNLNCIARLVAISNYANDGYSAAIPCICLVLANVIIPILLGAIQWDPFTYLLGINIICVPYAALFVVTLLALAFPVDSASNQSGIC